MGRLTDLKSILCQKKSLKGPPDQKWILPFWALWHHILQRCHDGLQPRRKKEGSGEGFGKRCANRVPLGPVRQVKSLIFDGGYSKITLLAFFPRVRKSLQKGSHFGGVWAPKSPLYSPGVLPEVIPEPFEATFFRTIFQSFSVTRSGSDPAECADPGSLLRDTPDGAVWSLSLIHI